MLESEVKWIFSEMIKTNHKLMEWFDLKASLCEDGLHGKGYNTAADLRLLLTGFVDLQPPPGGKSQTHGNSDMIDSHVAERRAALRHKLLEKLGSKSVEAHKYHENPSPARRHE